MPYPPVNVEAPALRVAEGAIGTHVAYVTLKAGEPASRDAEATRSREVDAEGRAPDDPPSAALGETPTGLIGSLAVGGSAIIQRNLDRAALDRRISLEHVTTVADAPG